VAGLSNAADLMLSGRMVRGSEFAAMGLASRALPSEQVLSAALLLAGEFRMAAPASVALSKRLLWEGITLGTDRIRQLEGPLFHWAVRQPDAAEGIASFLEKRDPVWKARVSRDLPGAEVFETRRAKLRPPRDDARARGRKLAGRGRKS
jgi:enoyl-CoA hydratase/carnithine racemase